MQDDATVQEAKEKKTLANSKHEHIFGA